MASLNPLTRELVFKIVFYGPGLGGKTSTLQYIFEATKPEHRGKMVSLATPTDRTLYFDFLPLRMPRIRGMSVRLQLFTVPGQMYFAATRKLVLAGADGVVFVADSQNARFDANRESLDDLQSNLREHGRELCDMPHTLLYNKRDLDETTPTAEMDRALNIYGAPSRGTVAVSGAGVFAGLEEITRRVLRAYEADLPRSSEGGLVPSSVTGGEVGLEEAIRGLTDRVAHPTPARGVDKLPAASAPSAPAAARPPSASPARAASNPPAHAHEQESAAPSSALTASPASSQSSPPADVHPPPQSPVPPPVAARVPSAPPASAARAPSVAPSVAPAVAPAPVREPSEAPPTRVPSMPPAPGRAPSVAPTATPGFTLAAVWPDADRPFVKDAEARLAARDPSGAVLACERLVMRSLAQVAASLGPDAPRDPAAMVLLVGIDGARYLEFRALVRQARSGERIDDQTACEALLFAAEARRVTSNVHLIRR